MPKPDETAAAEERAAEAQAALEKAQQEAAEAGTQLAATKTRDIPRMEVEVMPGSVVQHEGEAYYGEGYPLAPEGHKGGDTVTLDGPTAMSLMMLGHVRVKGAA